MRPTLVPVCSLVLLLAAAAEAATLKVPSGSYPTIQSAVDAAGAGDVIKIAAGTYAETVSVSVSDLTIKTQGSGVVIIDAGGSATSVLTIAGCDNVTVKSITVQNSTGDGIIIGPFASNVEIYKCKVKNVGDDGIAIGLAGPVHVHKCTVKNTGGDGVSVSAAGLYFEGNTVTDTGDNGIRVVGDSSTFIDNKIENTNDDGFYLGDGSSGCTFTLISGNEITNPGLDGIYARPDADYCTIIENKISSAASDGVEFVSGSDGHYVADNVIKKSAFEGIEVDSDGCYVSGNKIKKVDRYGIWVDANCDNATFFGNNVKKSGNDGVTIDGSYNVFILNKVSGSATYDLDNNTAAGNNGFIDNSFGTEAP